MLSFISIKNILVFLEIFTDTVVSFSEYLQSYKICDNNRLTCYCLSLDMPVNVENHMYLIGNIQQKWWDLDFISEVHKTWHF